MEIAMKYFLSLAAVSALAALPAIAQTCDRACLEGHLDKYVDAMLAHNPASLPLAKDVRFTENGQQLDLGEGLWASMAGKGIYKLVVVN